MFDLDSSRQEPGLIKVPVQLVDHAPPPVPPAPVEENSAPPRPPIPESKDEGGLFTNERGVSEAHGDFTTSVIQGSRFSSTGTLKSSTETSDRNLGSTGLPSTRSPFRTNVPITLPTVPTTKQPSESDSNVGITENNQTNNDIIEALIIEVKYIDLPPTSLFETAPTSTEPFLQISDTSESIELPNIDRLSELGLVKSPFPINQLSPITRSSPIHHL